MLQNIIRKIWSFLTYQGKNIIKIALLSLMLLPLLPNFSSELPLHQVAAQKAPSQEGAIKNEEELKTEQLLSRNEILKTISNIAYVIVWPLLVVAGMAMDNQLVYGEFMNFDNALWFFWNIMKNFANYLLGFLFLVSIIVYNFSPEGKISWVLKGISKPSDIIKKTLIAGILVQASWFIMLVLVDISTVLTYTVGAMPTNIIQQTNTEADYKLLSPNIVLNLKEAGTQSEVSTDPTIAYYWSYGSGKEKTNIAPCKMIRLEIGKKAQSFYIGRTFAEITEKQGNEEVKVKMEPGYCAAYGGLLSFNEVDLTKLMKNSTYEVVMRQFSADLQASDKLKIESIVAKGGMYPLFDGIVTLTESMTGLPGGEEPIRNSNYSFQKNSKCDIFWFVPGNSSKCVFSGTGGLTISSLIDKSKSYTGPFIAMYANLLDYSSLVDQGGELGTWQQFIIALLNMVFAVLLILPLFGLVVVLLARVGILWLVIAISPFLVIMNVFKDMFGDKLGSFKFLEIKELIKLLLAPVLIALAIGISIIFLSTLKRSLWVVGSSAVYKSYDAAAKEQEEKINNLLWVKVGTDGVDVLWFIKLKIDPILINFSWFLTMIFWLGIVWFLLFWAIKQNSVGASIGQKIQDLGKDALGAIPIIPTSSGMIWFSGAKEAVTGMVSDYSSALKKKDQETLNRRTWRTKNTDPERYTALADAWVEGKDTATFYGEALKTSDYVGKGGGTPLLSEIYKKEVKHLSTYPEGEAKTAKTKVFEGRRKSLVEEHRKWIQSSWEKKMITDFLSAEFAKEIMKGVEDERNAVTKKGVNEVETSLENIVMASFAEGKEISIGGKWYIVKEGKLVEKTT